MQQVESHFCTLAEIAKYFSVSYPTAINWVKSGQMKSIKIGKTIRIPSTEVQAFIDRNSNG